MKRKFFFWETQLAMLLLHEITIFFYFFLL